MNNNWKIIDGVIIDGEDGQHIAELCDGATPEQGEEIVKCVNAHAALVEAAESARACIQNLLEIYGSESDEGDHWYEATEAIAKLNTSLVKTKGE